MAKVIGRLSLPALLFRYVGENTIIHHDDGDPMMIIMRLWTAAALCPCTFINRTLAQINLRQVDGSLLYGMLLAKAVVFFLGNVCRRVCLIACMSIHMHGCMYVCLIHAVVILTLICEKKRMSQGRRFIQAGLRGKLPLCLHIIDSSSPDIPTCYVH